MTIDWVNFTPWASLSGGILGGLLPPKLGDAG